LLEGSWLRRLALPLSAPSVHAIGREDDSSVARVARYRGIQWASAGSKVMNGEREHKTAALAQAGERNAALEDGQQQDGASDGAVLSGHPCITCARRSSQPSVVVVLAPLKSSGAAERPARTSGADGRGVWLCGRRAGCMLCSIVLAPRSRCVAFLGLWCMVHGADNCCKRPESTCPNRTLVCGQECCFGAFGGV